jgi:hypothetical protein
VPEPDVANVGPNIRGNTSIAERPIEYADTGSAGVPDQMRPRPLQQGPEELAALAPSGSDALWSGMAAGNFSLSGERVVGCRKSTNILIK